MTARKTQLTWDTPEGIDTWQNDVFKELLRQLHEDRGLSVTALVRGIGASDPLIRKWLKAENPSTPGGDFIGPIANFFAVQFDKPVDAVMSRLMHPWS